MASFTAGLAFTIGYLSRQRAPDLDGERWFKVILVQLVTGRCEQDGSTTEQWVEAVKRAVPYHPAGRFPERKVGGLGLAGLPAALPGERALIERLATFPDRAARWSWLYDEDEAGLAARLDDPNDLGAAYDPVTVLGPQGKWDALVDWGAKDSAFPGLLAGRSPLWVLVDGAEHGQPAVFDALEKLLPRFRRVPWVDATAAPVEDALRDLSEDPSQRFVLVGQAEGIQTVLAAMVDNPGLRDRTFAVLSIGGAILGDPARTDWMEGRFTHHNLNTEMSRTTAYLAVQWLDRAADPPGAHGIEVRHARFPEAKAEAMTEELVQTVDLGVLPHDSDPLLVAKGLWAFVTLWVESHRR